MRIDKTRNTGTRNAIPGMGGMLYSGGMSPNIPDNVPNISGNVAKHSQEYRQIFWGMLSNIPGNVLKHSEKFCQTFWGILRIFGVKEDNYWAEPHLESC